MLNAIYYHAAVLIVIAFGLYNVMTAKNTVRAILSVEMMLAATNLIFMQASVRNGGDPLGQVVVITSIIIGAGLTAFLLSLAIKAYRETGNIDLQALSELKW